MNHFITFGNELFQNQKLRLKKEVEDTGWFSSITLESPETIQEFYNEHKQFIDNNKRGYGYWIWKPYIILRKLNEINYGDFLFYTDAGATIVPHKKNRLDDYISMLNNTDKPVITFSDCYLERYFQKMSVLKRFYLDGKPLNENEDFLKSFQIESGVFICKKTNFSEQFLKTWLDLLLENNYNLVIDGDTETQFTDFIDHRHDQSILSILCKINKTIILYGEAYGLGPFFSSRLTDNGPREFAPDSFRTDPRYNPEKHKTWVEWLADEHK